jgi:transposase Tn5 family protein
MAIFMLYGAGIPFPPVQPPSLQIAILYIARLGGFLARKGDGPPGVQTIWRGLGRLSDISATWLLIHSADVGNG